MAVETLEETCERLKQSAAVHADLGLEAYARGMLAAVTDFQLAIARNRPTPTETADREP